mgnify:CR=1 FL=1
MTSLNLAIKCKKSSISILMSNMRSDSRIESYNRFVKYNVGGEKYDISRNAR